MLLTLFLDKKHGTCYVLRIPYVKGGDDEGKKKKRRKKAPGGAKEKRAPAKSGGGGLRIIDDEADMPTLDKKRVNKAWEEEETEGRMLLRVAPGLVHALDRGFSKALQQACSL